MDYPRANNTLGLIINMCQVFFLDVSISKPINIVVDSYWNLMKLEIK